MKIKQHLFIFNRLTPILLTLTPVVFLLCFKGFGLTKTMSLYIMAPFPIAGILLLILGQIISADCPECNGPCKLKLGGVRYAISYICKNCDYKFRLKI